MTRRLRLLRVTVQAEFIADDGETLEPVAVEPVTLTAAEWASYPATFEAARQSLEAQINTDTAL